MVAWRRDESCTKTLPGCASPTVNWAQAITSRSFGIGQSTSAGSGVARTFDVHDIVAGHRDPCRVGAAPVERFEEARQRFAAADVPRCAFDGQAEQPRRTRSHLKADLFDLEVGEVAHLGVGGSVNEDAVGEDAVHLVGVLVGERAVRQDRHVASASALRREDFGEPASAPFHAGEQRGVQLRCDLHDAGQEALRGRRAAEPGAGLLFLFGGRQDGDVERERAEEVSGLW